MPIYEYRRRDGSTFEVMQKFSDDALTADPETGEPVERVYTAPAIHFKGSGFHNTDYGSGRRAKVGGGGESSSAGDSSSGGESSSAGDSSSGGESSSAGDSSSGGESSTGGSSGGSDSSSSSGGSSGSSSSGGDSPGKAASGSAD